MMIDRHNLTMAIVLALLALLVACTPATATPTIEETETPDDVASIATETATPTPTATATATPTATPTLLPTAQLPPACAPRTDWQLYTVVRGDTLGRIAQRTNSTVNTLAVANCIANPNNITVGQQIRVPRLPATATYAPPPPQRPLYRSLGKSTSFACAVFVNGTLAPLYNAPFANDPMVADLGNWAEWVRTINEFHQVNIYPSNTSSFISGYVNINDVTRAGTGCDDMITPLPADIWITQGSIYISSYITADAGNYQLRANETINLRWDGVPDALLQARFYAVSASTGVRTELGIDNTPNDGFTLLWTVPASLDSAHQLFAEGTAANAAAYDYARSFEQTIYVPATSAELDCPSASSTGDGTISMAPVDGVWSRCLMIQGSRTLTISWDEMPPDVTGIEYYFVPVAGTCNGAAPGNPNVIGMIDDVAASGAAISWYAGYSPCAGVVYAFGYTPTGMIDSQQRPFIIR